MEGLIVGAIGEREDARDAVVMSVKNKGKTLDQMAQV
jgi:porphobilinogen deaminase